MNIREVPYEDEYSPKFRFPPYKTGERSRAVHLGNDAINDATDSVVQKLG